MPAPMSRSDLLASLTAVYAKPETPDHAATRTKLGRRIRSIAAAAPDDRDSAGSGALVLLRAFDPGHKNHVCTAIVAHDLLLQQIRNDANADGCGIPYVEHVQLADALRRYLDACGYDPGPDGWAHRLDWAKEHYGASN